MSLFTFQIGTNSCVNSNCILYLYVDIIMYILHIIHYYFDIYFYILVLFLGSVLSRISTRGVSLGISPPPLWERPIVFPTPVSLVICSGAQIACGACTSRSRRLGAILGVCVSMFWLVLWLALGSALWVGLTLVNALINALF